MPKRSVTRLRARVPSGIEPLENRLLLSHAPVNVNITRAPQNQSEAAIAINPADTAREFEVSNIETGDGLMAAVSSDGGATWSTRLIADGHDGLPAACCDGSVAYDSFGNLFLAYLSANDKQVNLCVSTDNGHSFSLIQKYTGKVDQPAVVTGPGSVWLDFDRDPAVYVTGAAVTGLGTVGKFQPLRRVPGSDSGAFGDIAVGPQGQVIVTWERQAGTRSGKIYAAIDPDGLGPLPFLKKSVLITSTRVGDFDHIPPQRKRGIDAEVALAFDRSGGPFTGRVYSVYTDEVPAGRGNTDIYLRYSDNGGSIWSNPIRVNDDTTLNAQFFPRAVIDSSSGKLAISWYDARNDDGKGGAGDTNHLPNDDVQFYAALATPMFDGVQISPNLQISQGTTNASVAQNTVDLGDYTGLDFTHGVIRPVWADNSNSTGDNPNGQLHALDIYTARLNAADFAAPTVTSLGGLGGRGPVAALALKSQLAGGQAKGAAYTFQLTVAASSGMDSSTFNSANLLAAGPNEFSASPIFVKARFIRHGAYWLATYKIPAPHLRWSAADNGAYTLSLQPGQLKDLAGQGNPGGVIGGFVVAS